MSPFSVIASLVALAAAAGPAALPAPQAATTPPLPRRQSYTDRYAIIEQHNIFLRDRSRPSFSRSSSSTQPSRRSTEELLVLTGVVAEDEGYRAYVEDMDSSSVLKLAPGEPVGRGRVAAIMIDAIAYEHDGERTWIDVGHDLTGRSVAPAPLASAAAPGTMPSTMPSAGPSGVEGLNPADPNLTQEQRMKLNRIKELNRK